jgi:hypothetical protein
MVETTEKDGLIVSYDDETGTFSFEWDEKTHPEYDYLKDLTEEGFNKLLLDQIERLENEKASSTKIQEGGSSCGTTESDSDSGSQS